MNFCLSLLLPCQWFPIACRKILTLWSYLYGCLQTYICSCLQLTIGAPASALMSHPGELLTPSLSYHIFYYFASLSSVIFHLKRSISPAVMYLVESAGVLHPQVSVSCREQWLVFCSWVRTLFVVRTGDFCQGSVIAWVTQLQSQL